MTRRSFLAISGAALTSLGATVWRINPDDDQFLDDLSRRAFQYFWEHTDPDTGMTRGRAKADGAPYDSNRRDIGSIAVTGFGLTALCIGAKRGWVKGDEASMRVRNALRFFADHAPQEHGWFFHWMNVKTGERTGVLQNSEKKSELSSIDTALLMGGVLTARQYFKKDSEIDRLATRISERIDFQWMLNSHPALLSMHWTPEEGFSKNHWDHHCELGIMYLLGIASSTSPLPIESWYAWTRPTVTYAGYTYISGAPPLFVHQYSQAWIDFRSHREKRPPHTNWFDNSVTATRAHRQFCIDLAKEFPGYSENIWGITSSNSEKGYKPWGGPPRGRSIDGTVVPCAPAGSLMFAPDICIPALQAMKERFGDKIYGRYGFTDAFHPTNGWVSPDVLGLDTGITLLSAENLRSGNPWKWFMQNPEIPKAMQRAGM
jgi:hypothetical protein